MALPIEEMKRYLDGIGHLFDEDFDGKKASEHLGIVKEAEKRVSKKHSVAP